MSAAFYAEELGVSEELAGRIAGFMKMANNTKFVVEPRPWVGHGKARVYFKAWSQNSIRAFRGASKWYFDAQTNEVFGAGLDYMGSVCQTLAQIKAVLEESRRVSAFSGAKTRQALIEFAEVFYAQKNTWG